MSIFCGCEKTWLGEEKQQRRTHQEGSSKVHILIAAIKACSRTGNLDKGKKLHGEAVEFGIDNNIYISNALINMYTKCGSMVDAHEVFDGMKHQTVVSWTVLILGYADNRQGHIALDMFTRMRREGPQPNSVTLVAALKACTSLALEEGTHIWEKCRILGKELQTFAVESGCCSVIYVQSSLLDMYAKCGSMVDAHEIFDCMKHTDIVSWTALILGYADNGQGHAALLMFNRMRDEGLEPDSVAFVAALKACTSLSVEGGWEECRERGKEIHSLAVQSGCNSVLNVQNTLVYMYAKCGSMVDAGDVFHSMKHPDVVSWNTLISGYADNGQSHTALGLFSRMRNEDLVPDSVSLVAALKACTSLAETGASQWVECRNRGKEMHSIVVQNGCNSDLYVQNTLLDMYAKCSSMVDAREVFNGIKHPDVVSWTALILGYADNGQGRTALDTFTWMRTEGPAPNSVTLMAALKACGLLGALEFGRTIHSELDRGNNLDTVLVTCLVDFYAKCGSLVEAQTVFDLHAERRDMVTWSALLAGFSSCGDSEAVLRLFEGMQDASLKPSGVIFLCILKCCSHAGLVVEGKQWFDSMSTKYGLIPTVEHYTCMIDLLGRANRLHDAMALLELMPCSPNEVTWMTILGACRKWKDVEIGRIAFQSLIDLNYRDAAAYMLMAQIYWSAGMLQEQEMVMELRKKLKALKTPEETCWTNEAGDVHSFLADDSQHPQIKEIRDKWESISLVMRQHSQLSIPHNMNVEKEEALCGHSERLALVCALINTEARKTVRIVKNLRVCDDCHTAISFVSKLDCRSIICRDVSRIHIFEDGKCSCGDFW